MGTQYYNAVSHSTSPYITVYGQDGDVSSKIADPATLPGGSGRFAAWSADGVYLAVASQTTPFVQIYKRSGDVLTKLTDPGVLPSAVCFGVAWSADGTYLSVTLNASPYIIIYKRSGDVFTKLSDPAALPGNRAMTSSWSADGVYLAVALFNSPYILIYKRAADVFTKLSDPATLPAGTGRGISFAPNGTYLSVAHTTSPFITTYKRAGDVFTKLSNPATLPGSNVAYGCSWSADSTYLAVAHQDSPYVTVYKRAADVLTKISDPDTLPPATAGNGASWSGDGSYLSISSFSSPYVNVYSLSSDTLTRVANPATLPTGSGAGTAYVENPNAAPFAPTWVAPADNSYQDRDASLLLDWDFVDGDAGDSMSAYALSKSVDGATLEHWNASTSAWVAAEVKNPTATTSVTLASGWATAGESVEYKAKTWDAADAAGPYGLGLTINAATATVPVLDAPATSATITGSSADIAWTVAAQAAYQVRVLTSADAELFSTGKITGAVTEITLGYVFSDGQTGLKVELTTWNAFDIPGLDTNSGISVSYTPPAVPVLTVTANAAGYLSVAIADPTPAGSQPTVVTHDIFVRVAAGGRQVGERTVNDDGIRISIGTATNGTYLDYAAATGTDFEYRTLARAGTATTYSEWS
jgi:WD40 repeat protein